MHDFDNYEHDYTWTWKNEVKAYFSIGFCIVMAILVGFGLGTLTSIIYMSY